MLQDKNIIVVLGWLQMGGAERQALLLARHLAKERGANVQVIAFYPGEVSTLLDEMGIAWRVLPWPWVNNKLRRVRALLRFSLMLRREKPDLILPYTTLPSVFCGLIWKLTGAQACFFNLRDEGRDITGMRAERMATRNVTKVIANSRHAAELLRRTFHLDPARVQTIWNGVRLAPPQDDRATWRARLGLTEDRFAACMVANLHGYKDHATLLRAWHLVLQQTAQRHASTPVLLLAGLFLDTHKPLQTLAEELNLGDSVRFLDGVSDVPGLLGAVDLGVFSSRTEGVPNGVLECMACGLALAATDIPGIREALGEGDEADAQLAPPNNAPALAARILHFIDHPQGRHDIGSLNHQRVAREFSPERMCREMSELLESGLHPRVAQESAVKEKSV